MKTILAALAVLAGITTAAQAKCDAVYTPSAQLIGRTAWIANDTPSRLPRNVADYKGFLVPILTQTGPKKWEPDYGRNLPHAAQVKVVRFVEYHDSPTLSDIPRYVEIEFEEEKHVMAAAHLLSFDFTKCGAQHVLRDRKLYENRRVQLLDALPMVVKAGVRPMDFSGKWVDDKWLEDLVLVDCMEYGKSYLHAQEVVQCSLVWRNGVDLLQYSLPRDLYFTPDQLEQITSMPTHGS